MTQLSIYIYIYVCTLKFSLHFSVRKSNFKYKMYYTFILRMGVVHIRTYMYIEKKKQQKYTYIYTYI